jgi:hypothetical protein
MAGFFATHYPRRRFVKKIVEKRTVSKETAKTCEEPGMSKSTLEYLVFVKDIKKTENDRYYVFREH